MTHMEFEECLIFQHFRYAQRGALVDVGAHKGNFCAPLIARG